MHEPHSDQSNKSKDSYYYYSLDPHKEDNEEDFLKNILTKETLSVFYGICLYSLLLLILYLLYELLYLYISSFVYAFIFSIIVNFIRDDIVKLFGPSFLANIWSHWVLIDFISAIKSFVLLPFGSIENYPEESKKVTKSLSNQKNLYNLVLLQIVLIWMDDLKNSWKVITYFNIITFIMFTDLMMKLGLYFMYRVYVEDYETAEIRQFFTSYNKNGLNRDEIRSLLHDVNLPEKHINAFIERADKNKDDCISTDEFLNVYKDFRSNDANAAQRKYINPNSTFLILMLVSVFIILSVSFEMLMEINNIAKYFSENLKVYYWKIANLISDPTISQYLDLAKEYYTIYSNLDDYEEYFNCNDLKNDEIFNNYFHYIENIYILSLLKYPYGLYKCGQITDDIIQGASNISNLIATNAITYLTSFTSIILSILSQFSEFVFAFGIFIGVALFFIQNIISKKYMVSKDADKIVLKPIYDTYKTLFSLYGLSFLATSLYLQFINVRMIYLLSILAAFNHILNLLPAHIIVQIATVVKVIMKSNRMWGQLLLKNLKLRFMKKKLFDAVWYYWARFIPYVFYVVLCYYVYTGYVGSVIEKSYGETFTQLKKLIPLSILLGYYSFGLDGIFIGPSLLHFLFQLINYLTIETKESSKTKVSIGKFISKYGTYKEEVEKKQDTENK